MALSLSAAIGQIFILITIKEFGALLFATIMTTRQFISILLSCILFMHPLSLGQWAGTVLVFGALYYKMLTGGAGKGKKSDVTPREDATPEEMQELAAQDNKDGGGSQNGKDQQSSKV